MTPSTISGLGISIAQSRPTWTFERFKDRLVELQAKIQQHEEGKVSLSKGQESRNRAEVMKLEALVAECDEKFLEDSAVPATALVTGSGPSEGKELAVTELECSPEDAEAGKGKERKDGKGKEREKGKKRPADGRKGLDRSVKRRLNEDIQFVKKECLNCRTFGHVLASCPELHQKGQPVNRSTVTCWRCGSGDHSLPECPASQDAENSLPFAVCFVCNEKGHLAAKCPINPNGIYPKGGSCFRCGSIYHLAVNCTMRAEKIAEKRQNRQDKRGRVSADKSKDKLADNEPAKGTSQTIEDNSETPKRPRGTRGGKQVQARKAVSATGANSVGVGTRNFNKVAAASEDRKSGPFGNGKRFGTDGKRSFNRDGKKPFKRGEKKPFNRNGENPSRGQRFGSRGRSSFGRGKSS